MLQNPADKWAKFILGKRKNTPVQMPAQQQVKVVLTRAAQRQQARWKKPGIGA